MLVPPALLLSVRTNRTGSRTLDCQRNDEVHQSRPGVHHHLSATRDLLCDDECSYDVFLCLRGQRAGMTVFCLFNLTAHFLKVCDTLTGRRQCLTYVHTFSNVCVFQAVVSCGV